MSINSTYSDTPLPKMDNEMVWRELYPSLRLLTRRLVYAFRVPSWRGQEDDIAEDIVQEAARRIIERSQKAGRGEATPIHAFEHMVVVTAYNYCKDMRRRDRRLIHLVVGDYALEGRDIVNDRDEPDLSEAATEHVYQEALFTLLAREIARFPDKQRRVLLIDLANRMCFGTQPTPLQEAFLKVGIRLQEYQQPLPDDPKERSRCTSLLNHAYKRIAQLGCVRQYASVA